MVYLKSERELALMRKSNGLVSKILSHLASMVEPGINLLELDKKAASMAKEHGAKCAFYGYSGFPGHLCASVNEEIVHGIPKDRVLQEGDVVGLDFGIVQDGFFGDSAVTIPVGTIPASSAKLLKVTADSLYAAIDAARPGNTLKDLAQAIEDVVNPHRFGIVKEFVGHGIGQKLHEDPQIPNYVAGASKLKLQEGMTIAIEPMINAGSDGMKILEDKWTAVTTDGSLSAHYEHTIAITSGAPEILTDWESPHYGGLLDRLAAIN